MIGKWRNVTAQHRIEGRGFGQCCSSMILSSVAHAQVFPHQFLHKAEAGGVAGRGGTGRLVGVPEFCSMTLYPSP